MAEALQQWMTLGDLRWSGRLSPAIIEILRGLVPSRHFDTPTVDLSSYIEQVLRLGRQQKATSNEFVFHSVTRIVSGIDIEGVIRSGTPADDSTLISAGLSEVFEDAHSIRRITGGRNEYIGARHIIASIATMQSSNVDFERQLAVEPIGRFDWREFVILFSGLLRQALELGESSEGWQEILRGRGFAEAALQFEPLPDVSGRPAPSTRHLYQPDAIPGLRNDDPMALPDKDVVGNDDAARALARVIAAKSFAPPLAVGVFGPWGSGKSFFLRRVQREISRVSAMSEAAYHDNLIAIRFNAWHYVDTDLWASLVGQIFEELDKHTAPKDSMGSGLLDRLTTARELAIESARALAMRRREAREAGERLRQAELELEAQKRAVSTRLCAISESAKEAIVSIAQDERVSTFVQATYGQQLSELAATWKQPRVAAKALQRDGAIWQKLVRDLSRPAPVASAILIAMVLFVSPLWLPYIVSSVQVAEFIKNAHPIALALSGVLLTAGGWFAKLTASAIKARDLVVNAVETYKVASDRAAAVQRKQLDLERAQVDAAGLKVDVARQSLDAAVKLQIEAAREFARERPADRLRTFVRTRAAIDGPYRSRQGLVSTIRRDFGDLAGLLKAAQSADSGNAAAPGSASTTTAAELSEKWFQVAVEKLKAEVGADLTCHELQQLNPPAPKADSVSPTIDRIVLLIDDLDRCSAEKVLDVLQAVHLLMAFELFVVIVAVDVRWLEGALEERFRQFSLGKHAPEPLEYLEKVFQLAVWTQPLQRDNIGKFIRGRLKTMETTPANGGSDGSGPPEPPNEPPTPGGPDAPSFDPVGATQAVQSRRANEGVGITSAEIVYLEAVAVTLDMTPRRLLRLLNSYQVARASLGHSAFDALIAGGYRGLVAIMALAVARPDAINIVFDALQTAEDWQSFSKLVASRVDPQDLGEIEAWRRVIEGEAAVEDVREHAILTLRFSFSGPGLQSRAMSG